MYTRLNRQPQPRGRRQWNVALAVFVLVVAMAVVTVKAARRSPDDRILQPTDPGVVTRTISPTAK
jgi:ferric-dicitrate binding protein FerR (iron transport regulator)